MIIEIIEIYKSIKLIYKYNKNKELYITRFYRYI